MVLEICMFVRHLRFTGSDETVGRVFSYVFCLLCLVRIIEIIILAMHLNMYVHEQSSNHLMPNLPKMLYWF